MSSHSCKCAFFICWLSPRPVHTVGALCAAACGAAQSASSASQQTSQSNPATPNGEFAPVHLGDRGYVGVYLGDLNADRARDLGLKEIRGRVVGRVKKAARRPAPDCRRTTSSSPSTPSAYRTALTSIVCSSIHNQERSLAGDQPRSRAETEGGFGTAPFERPDPQRLFSEANAHLASAAESRKLAEAAQQRGDEKGRAASSTRKRRSANWLRRAALTSKERFATARLPNANRRAPVTTSSPTAVKSA